jgi:hypothetical protein
MKIRPIEWNNGNGKNESWDGTIRTGVSYFSFLIVPTYRNKEEFTLYGSVALEGSFQDDSEVIGQNYKTVEEAKLAAVKFIEDFIKGLLETDTDKE